MPRIQTKCFGEVEYSPDAVFEFPNGLPGFETEHAFVFLEQPANHPLMFMQSLSRPDVCFILLPVLAADPRYKLRVAEEDLAALHLPAGRQPRIGRDVLCAVLVCAADEERPDPTVNLLAPILVNLKRQIGIQAIQTQAGYSYRHPLVSQDRGQELLACS
jgi:flagellar assembly factor FliW